MARRKRKAHNPTSGPGEITQRRSVSPGLIVAIILTLLLGGIPFGCGKYIEFNSPGPFDSGAYVYSAKHLLDGAQMGVDENASARPGTLIANIIGVKLFGFNDTGPKIVQMVLQLAALIFMFITLRNVFGSVAAVIGTTLAAVYLSAPLIAKFGNVKEQFMIPFMIGAACCFCLHAITSKRFWLVLSGFLAMQPYYFKPTGVSIVIAIVVCLLTKNAVRKNLKGLVRDCLLFLVGYTAGLIVPAALFIWQKQLPALLRSFPVVAIEIGFLFLLLLAGLAYGVSLLKAHGVKLKQVNISKTVWVTGLIVIAAAALYSIWIIRNAPGYIDGDIGSYIHSTPFVTFPKTVYVIISGLFSKLMLSAGLGGSYVSDSWKSIGLSKLAPQIGRYYKALSVPILLALASVVTAAWPRISRLFKKTATTPTDAQSGLVWALALWWFLDMAFVWASPRSYEQYYLPLCASAAMLAGFAVWKWQQRFTLAANKMPWLFGGLATAITLGCLSIPIFIGQRYSPDHGQRYMRPHPQTGQPIPERRRGFAQSLDRVKKEKITPSYWQQVGEYIKTHSTEDDTLYVWGWVPGIYVQAQRLAPVPKAFESDMHVTPPGVLKGQIDAIVKRLKQSPPKFIVDTRKQHFPNDRPPLELWPMVPEKSGKKRFLRNDEREIAAFESFYADMLEKQIDADEAQRFRAMKPFRDFVMNNYRFVKQYGQHILFERIEPDKP